MHLWLQWCGTPPDVGALVLSVLHAHPFLIPLLWGLSFHPLDYIAVVLAILAGLSQLVTCACLTHYVIPLVVRATHLPPPHSIVQ